MPLVVRRRGEFDHDNEQLQIANIAGEADEKTEPRYCEEIWLLASHCGRDVDGGHGHNTVMAASVALSRRFRR